VEAHSTAPVPSVQDQNPARVPGFDGFRNHREGRTSVPDGDRV